MFYRLLMVGLNHRLVAFLLLLLVTSVAAMGLSRIIVDTGFDSMISHTDPKIPVYDRVAEEFGSDNRTIVYIRDTKLWTPSKLAALESLHYALEEIDFVERVDDLFTLRSIRGSEGKVESRILLAEAPPDEKSAEQARAAALYNPLIVGNYLSRDGTVTAMVVTLRNDYEDKRTDHKINETLEHVIRPSRSVFQEVFQVGGPRINSELKATLFDDLARLGPLSAAVLVAAILLFLRSGFAAIVPLVTSGIAIVWTFGMMGWTGIPLNILSAMLPTLVVVIGSTEDTHMIASYFSGVSRMVEDHRSAATHFMMKHMGVPLILTVLTTAMGFASNMFSGMGIIRDFAVAATFAILANGVITIVLVPILLSLMGPVSRRLMEKKNRKPGIAGIFVGVFDFTNRRFPRVMLGLTALLCGFFIYHLSGLYVTNDPLSYFRQDRPLIQDIRKIHTDLSGMKLFFISLESELDKAFLEPSNLEKLTAIQEFVEKQAIFDRSISLADHLSLINREFNDGDPEAYQVPDRRELVAQYLLFFHRRDIESYVSHDYKRANIVVRHNVGDSNTLNQHVRELEEVVAHIAGNRIKAHVVGENLMVNAAADDLMVAQVKSLIILLCVIFFIMSAMFTSFTGGIISLIPNLIPIILMFGLMGLLKIPLNPGTAMVAVIAIGIAIDGTIHLLARYNDLCRRTSDYRWAVRKTVQEESTPMVATSLALALGFGILLKSNFTIIAQFGALSAATMLFALFANLLVTPIIMSRIRLVGLYQIVALSMHRDVLEKSPLFRGMSNYQIRKAILISELNEFGKGDLLVEQGTFGRNMYLIISGEAEVVRRSGGTESRVAILGPGQVLGEIGYIRKTRRTADVRALSHLEVLRFDYRKIRKDLKFFPYIVANLNFNISCILGERLADVWNTLAPDTVGETKNSSEHVKDGQEEN